MTNRTWNHKHGLLGFAYGGEAPSNAVRRGLVARFVELLEPIAVVKSMTVAFSNSMDEYKYAGNDIKEALLRVHANEEKLAEIDIDCDLRCTDENGNSVLLAGVLRCNLEFGALEDANVGQLVSAIIWLDVDVHVAKLWPDRDNRPVAAINAPAFNRFLAKVPNTLGLALEDVYSDYYNYYPELVNLNGFTIVPIKKT